MGWETSDRRSRLPADWARRRDWVRDRAGGRCEAVLRDTGERCPARGTDCDHVERGDDHRVENLQWLCSWHHKRKTADEARAELEALRRARRPRRPRHPGLVDGS